MANLGNLFPNLTGDPSVNATLGDFITAVGTVITDDNRTQDEKDAGRQKVDNWARHGSQETIPFYRLPDFEISSTFTYTDPDLTGTSATPRTPALALDAFILAFDAATTGPLFADMHAADHVLITYTPDGANTADTSVAHYIYVGADVLAGGTLSAGDFRLVNEAQAGVTTLAKGTNDDSNIIISTTAGGNDISAPTAGDLFVRLDKSLAEIESINIADSTAFTIGHSTLASAGDVTINANNLDINAERAITMDGTGLTVTVSGIYDIDATGAATIDGSDVTLTAGTSSVDVDAAGVTIATTATGNDISLSVPTDGDINLSATTQIVRPSAGATRAIGIDENGNITTDVSVGGGAYSYNGLDNTDTTVALNSVNYIRSIDSTTSAATGNQTYQLPTATNGQWIKLVNNAPAAAQIIISTATSTQTIFGTGDNLITIDDPTANFEMIFTEEGWIVMAT